jgi:hypothetical protein
MVRENLQKYVYVLLFIHLSFVLVNLSGFFPVTLEIAGFDVIDNVSTTMEEIQSTFSESASGLDYMVMAGFLVFNGVKLLIGFVMLTLAGPAPIMGLLGVPAAIYLPISGVIGAVVLYDFAKMLLRLG